MGEITWEEKGWLKSGKCARWGVRILDRHRRSTAEARGQKKEKRKKTKRSKAGEGGQRRTGKADINQEAKPGQGTRAQMLCKG